jgi:DnaJ family protein B protein 11
MSKSHISDQNGSSRFFGGGQMEEEEKIVKGDDVIVELDATLEDLYMGGSLKVRDA